VTFATVLFLAQKLLQFPQPGSFVFQQSAASVRLVFDGEVEAHDAAGSGEPEVALVEVQVVHAGA